MTKDVETCLYCQKTFKALPNHLRARHPEEYKLHVQFELECIEHRITQLEALAPNAPPPKPPKQESVAGGLFVITSFDKGDPVLNDRKVYLKEALVHLDETPDSAFGAHPLVRPQIKSYLDRELKQVRGRAKVSPESYDRETITVLIAADHSMEAQSRLRVKGIQQELDQKAAGGVTCTICGEQFKNQGGATNHLRKVHPDVYLEQIETYERGKNIVLNNPHAPEAERVRAFHLVNSTVAFDRFSVLVDLGRYVEAIAQLRIWVGEYALAYENSSMAIIHMIENMRRSLDVRFKDQPVPAVLAEGIDAVVKEFSIIWKCPECGTYQDRNSPQGIHTGTSFGAGYCQNCKKLVKFIRE